MPDLIALLQRLADAKVDFVSSAVSPPSRTALPS
jgi:hypothetical protein